MHILLASTVLSLKAPIQPSCAFHNRIMPHYDKVPKAFLDFHSMKEMYVGGCIAREQLVLGTY